MKRKQGYYWIKYHSPKNWEIGHYDRAHENWMLIQDKKVFSEAIPESDLIEIDERIIKIHDVIVSIKSSDLIDNGYEESYYNWFTCPECKSNGLSKTDNYCSGCGIKIEN